MQTFFVRIFPMLLLGIVLVGDITTLSAQGTLSLIHGVVLDENHRPLDKVKIMNGIGNSAYTNNMGQYRLIGRFQAGKDLDLRLYKEGYEFLLKSDLTINQEGRMPDMTLKQEKERGYWVLFKEKGNKAKGTSPKLLSGVSIDLMGKQYYAKGTQIFIPIPKDRFPPYKPFRIIFKKPGYVERVIENNRGFNSDRAYLREVWMERNVNEASLIDARVIRDFQHMLNDIEQLYKECESQYYNHNQGSYLVPLNDANTFFKLYEKSEKATLLYYEIDKKEQSAFSKDAWEFRKQDFPKYRKVIGKMQEFTQNYKGLKHTLEELAPLFKDLNAEIEELVHTSAPAQNQLYYTLNNLSKLMIKILKELDSSSYAGRGNKFYVDKRPLCNSLEELYTWGNKMHSTTTTRGQADEIPEVLEGMLSALNRYCN